MYHWSRVHLPRRNKELRLAEFAGFSLQEFPNPKVELAVTLLRTNKTDFKYEWVGVSAIINISAIPQLLVNANGS